MSEREVPRTSKLGHDRPPRVYQSVGGRRSEIQQADLHQRAEDDLAREAAVAIEELHQSGEMRALIVVAPSRTLGMLQHMISGQMQNLILKEVAKDLTGLPIYEIEQHLMQL
jgi:protein required for attachment to host cells